MSEADNIPEYASLSCLAELLHMDRGTLRSILRRDHRAPKQTAMGWPVAAVVFFVELRDIERQSPEAYAVQLREDHEETLAGIEAGEFDIFTAPQRKRLAAALRADMSAPERHRAETICDLIEAIDRWGASV